MRFLYGLRKRVALEGNGPRCFMLKEDRAVVPTYFSDTLNVVDLKTTSVEALAMVKNRVESRIQRGEKYFNDAMHCFQIGSRAMDATREMHVWMP